MAWVCVDKNGIEFVTKNKPIKFPFGWEDSEGEYEGYCDYLIVIPNGYIQKLIGRSLTWEDEPFELKGYENNR